MIKIIHDISGQKSTSTSFKIRMFPMSNETTVNNQEVHLHTVGCDKSVSVFAMANITTLIIVIV